MTASRHVLAVAIALLALAASARAQSSSCEIDLGGGIGVRRTSRPCYGWRAGRRDRAWTCTAWSPLGFTFGAHRELEGALTFTRTAGGRVVALFSIGRLGILEGGVTYTDDLGQTWRAARWPSGGSEPVAVSFDPFSPRGAAVGVDGNIRSSEDDGASWDLRRRTAGTTYVAVWVRGHTVVVQDAAGVLWRSPDGGFALESLAARGARIETDGEELLVIEPRRTRRIDRRGTMHSQ